MRSEKSKEQQRKYDKQMTKFVGLKLNRKTDAILIKKLESQPNMQGYLKMLIRHDIEREKGILQLWHNSQKRYAL